MKLEYRGKILILTGRFGEGHQQVANALQSAATEKLPEVKTKIIDFLAWGYPKLFSVSNYVYMKGIKTFPNLYGFLYKKTYETSPFSKIVQDMLSIGMQKMIKLLQIEKPSVIVSTYPFTSSVVSKLKENGLTTVPFITVITDHSHHSYWLNPYTEKYIVDSNETKEELVHLGIPTDKIAGTGIPIRNRFLQNHGRKNLIAKYHLETDLPTVLIMGGGDGLIGKGLLKNKRLEAIPKKLQLIILCGHNKKLRHYLQKELENSKHHIILKGYVDQVDEWMAVSDLIVTKPGGVTTAEALAVRLPMLLYRPLPGQEEDNARYLIDSGVAIQANHPADVISKLSELLGNSQMLSAMKQNAGNLQTKKAADEALKIICQSFGKEEKLVANLDDQLSQTNFRPLRSIKNSFLYYHGQ